MRSLRESSFIWRAKGSGGTDGSGEVSAISRLPVESAGRLSDSDEPREDDDATSGGKQGMTGAEHETIMADAAQDRQVARVDDPRRLDCVAERAVREAHIDPVAGAQRVEMSEGSAIGRAVAGDRRRPMLAG